MKWALAVVGAAACSRRAPSILQAELVANPLGDWRTAPSEAAARSLWDLQAYEGRLYLGYGDAVENTGPTDVISFDPATGGLAHEVTLQEEAITTYRVIDDQLVVPGVDALDPANGSIYLRSAGDWHQLVVPQAVHVDDVAPHGDELCAAVQDRMEGAALRCTRDGGGTWDTRAARGFRATTVFELGSELLVGTPGRLARIDEHGLVPLSFALPGVTDLSNVELRRPTRCGDAVVLLAVRATYVNNAVHVEPLGAFALKPGPSASKIDVEGTPSDVFASDDTCYLLTSRSAESGRYVATIYAMRSDRWEKEVVASVDALARSGEHLGPFFYIGLGCERGACTANAGHLVRVPAVRADVRP